MIRKLSLLISIFMMALGTSAAETDFLMVSDFSASSGSQVVMPIIMTNSVAANTIAFQCELVLPAGVSVATDEYGDAMIDISTARTTAKRHSVSSSLQADGSMGIVVTSQSNSAFSGTSGEVLTVTLNIDSNVASGTYSVSIRNQELTATDLTKKKVSVKSASLVINGGGSTPEEPSEGGEEGNVPAVASDNYLTIDNLCVTPGTTKMSLPIKLVNKVASNIIAFQTELVLPQGISVAEDEFGDAMIDISTERTTAKRHSVSSSIQADGSIGIVVTSQSNSPFSGSEGEVLNVELNIPSDMAVGKYVISLRNQELTAVNLTKTKVESVNAFISVKEPEYSDTYTMIFMVGDVQHHTATLKVGEEITLPQAPIKEGYTFKGWEGLPEDMLMPSNDLTVAAIFEQNAPEIPDDDEDVEDTDISSLADAVYANAMEGRIGSQLVLPIQMKNSIEAIGFQADLVLPDGVTVAEGEDGLPMVELSTQRTTATKTNMFDYSYQPDGSLRILCSSTKGYAFTGNDGEVALVTLNISEEIEEGNYPITIKNIVITDAQGIDKKKVDLVRSTLTLFAYMLGDVNGDNEVDVADISSLSSYILGRVVPGFVEKAADLNEDTEIDVADISALAYFILHPETAQKAKARKVAEKKENVENTDNTLYAEMLQAEGGTDVVLPIMMRNGIEATGFQLDLMLPEGVTLKDATLSNARTTSKRTNLFDYARQADGTYRILCNSTKGLSFNGHDGEVMTLTLHIDKDAELGAQTIALKDMVLTDATGMLREESSLSESTLWVGNATGIHEMASEKSAPIYDLQGRQVSKKQKGIHIQNGKKTVVK